MLVLQEERRIEVRTREDPQRTTQIAGEGGTVHIRVHVREIAVDAIYV